MTYTYLNLSQKGAFTQLLYLICLFFFGFLLLSLVQFSLIKLGFSLTSYVYLSINLVFSQVLVFFGPALFWGFYYKPDPWRENLSIRPIKKNHLLLLLITLLSIPASSIFVEINLWLIFSKNFPTELREHILATENTIHQLILPLFTELNPAGYIITLLLVALLPAICEELLFRAVLQKILIKLTQKPMLGIYFTALVFAFFHGQFLGLIPRFFLGIVLGLLFYQSRNILAPIIFHFIFNSKGVLAVFFLGTEQLHLPKSFQPELYNWLIGASSLILFIALWQYQIKKK